jgi:hypothetical protein
MRPKHLIPKIGGGINNKAAVTRRNQNTRT